LAPRDPYRPAAGAPYRGGGDGILELPIAVTPVARLPVIGTSLIVAPAWMRRRLVAGALRARLFNLGLHGIGLCDAQGAGVPASVVARQPDLRRPLAHKIDVLEQTLQQAGASGARFVTLAEAASLVGPSP